MIARRANRGWEGGMRLQRRRFSEPSDVRTIPNGRIDIVDLDDTVVGRMTYEPGWRWSVDIQPIAGTETCQYHHLGITLSGRLRAQMADGTELELGPGDVFEIPPGHDAWVVGEEPWVSVDFEAMRTFGRQRDARDERILATMVFTDIVDSTRRAGELGAARWRDLVGEHNRKASAAIDRHRGRLVKTTGDGVLAQFDGAERAVRGAAAIREAAHGLGLEVRAGVLGCVERSGGRLIRLAGRGRALEAAGLGGRRALCLSCATGRGSLGLAGGACRSTLGPGGSGDFRAMGLGQSGDGSAMRLAADRLDGLGDCRDCGAVIAGAGRLCGEDGRGRESDDRDRRQDCRNEPFHGGASSDVRRDFGTLVAPSSRSEGAGGVDVDQWLAAAGLPWSPRAIFEMAAP